MPILTNGIHCHNNVISDTRCVTIINVNQQDFIILRSNSNSAQGKTNDSFGVTL